MGANSSEEFAHTLQNLILSIYILGCMIKAVVRVQSNLEISANRRLPFSVCLANQTFLSLSRP